MSRRLHPTTGTAGGLHHERESFRSGWNKANEFLTSRIYQGEMPEADAVLLVRWYGIRKELLESKDRTKFDNEVKAFNALLPEDTSAMLVNAMKLITGYLSENNGVRG